VGISLQKRFTVLKRDNFSCVYCGATGKTTTLHVDHEEPASQGGDDSTENLRTACQECNLGKGARLAFEFPSMDLGILNDYVSPRFAFRRDEEVDMVAYNIPFPLNRRRWRNLWWGFPREFHYPEAILDLVVRSFFVLPRDVATLAEAWRWNKQDVRDLLDRPAAAGLYEIPKERSE